MSDLPTVLPVNASEIERDLEQLSTRLHDMPETIAALWDADICPAHLLPFLAWAFSVEVWEPSWPEAQRRQVIVDAVQVHRFKGTVGSVRRALGGIGFRTDISEWFEHGGDPHTFQIDAYGDDIFAAGFQIDPALLHLVTLILINVKPERSHFELRIGERFDTGVNMRVGTRGKARQDVHHDPDPRTRLATVTRIIRGTTRPRQLSQITHDIQRRAA